MVRRLFSLMNPRVRCCSTSRVANVHHTRIRLVPSPSPSRLPEKHFHFQFVPRILHLHHLRRRPLHHLKLRFFLTALKRVNGMAFGLKTAKMIGLGPPSAML